MKTLPRSFHVLNFFPLLVRELKVFLRTRAAFLLFLVLLFGLSGIFIMIFDNSDIQETHEAYRARALFHAIGFFGMCGFGAVAALTTATRVTAEREQRTFELLRCTGLSTFAIIAGKWLASIGYLVLMFLLLIPVLAMTLQMGGVAPVEMLQAAVIIAVTILYCACVGIAVSTWVRRSWLAIIVVVTLLTLHMALLPLGYILAIDHWLNFDPSVSFLSPTLYYAEQFIDDFGYDEPVIGKPFVQFICSHAVVALGPMLIAGEPLAPRASSHHLTGLTKEQLLRRRRHFPFYLVDPLRGGRPIGNRQNPVLVKESRASAAGRVTVIIRFFYAAVAFSLLQAALLVDEENPSTLGVLAAGFTLVFLPIYASNGISREHQEQTLDLLLSSPLPTWRIVAAHYRLAIRFSFILAAGTYVFPFVLAVYSIAAHEYLDGLGRSLALCAAWLAFYAAVAVFAGSWFRGNLGAIIAGYVTVWGCFLLLPIATTLIGEIALDWNGREIVEELWLRPIFRWLTPIPFFEKAENVQSWTRAQLQLIPAALLVWATSRRLARRRI